MVKIDESRCIGCGICQNVCPDGFEVVARKAHIKDDKADCILQASRACPKGAIILDDSIPISDPKRDLPEGFGRGRGMGRRGGRGRGRGMGRW